MKEKPLSCRVSDREMRELQVIHDEARSCPSPLDRGTNTLPKKSQFIAETLAPIVRQVAGEIPPLGFELVVRMMITRKVILPAWRRDPPVRRHAAHRQNGNPIGHSNSEACDSPHSLRTASATLIRPARHAGIHPATTAAAMIQIGVQASDHHGKAS